MGKLIDAASEDLKNLFSEFVDDITASIKGGESLLNDHLGMIKAAMIGKGYTITVATVVTPVVEPVVNAAPEPETPEPDQTQS